jgi:UDP-N-acetylmuramoyl-tripeptide--D-alanyl-D-alanine ligase
VRVVGTLTTSALDLSRLHTGPAWITVGLCVAACVPAGLRWLRVAQREHYLAGSVTRFATRWWRSTATNLVGALGGAVAAVASLWFPLVGILTAVVVAAGPLGLSVRGRTSPLAWTRRVRTLAAVWALLEAVVVVVGWVLGVPSVAAVVAAMAVPLLVDMACAVASPFERRASTSFVDQASRRLAAVHPTIVAITGSFGKTSTKNHVAHIVRAARSVVATPASFNNRAGLARAVNEHLAEGTEVFVAEMGTYGPGEIADLCRWCPPDIAVITAIGPVHLERFGSEDRIVTAKAEIIEHADRVVLPVDDRRLAALADAAAAAGKRVYRCSTTDRSADVCVVASPGEKGRSCVSAFVAGKLVGEGLSVPTGVQPTNLACAVGVALALDIEPALIVDRLRDLPSVDHRLAAVESPSGVVILDDTYNANPAGADAALRALVAAAARGSDPPAGVRRLAVVTPGMVELGDRQFEENRRFASAVVAVATDLVIVGRTNRRALEAGARAVDGAPAEVTLVRDRRQAVDWVRTHLASGDVVLYENDLPDHYP